MGLLVQVHSSGATQYRRKMAYVDVDGSTIAQQLPEKNTIQTIQHNLML